MSWAYVCATSAEIDGPAFVLEVLDGTWQGAILVEFKDMLYMVSVNLSQKFKNGGGSTDVACSVGQGTTSVIIIKLEQQRGPLTLILNY